MNSLKLTIGRKLTLLAALAVVAIIGVLLVSSWQIRDALMEERRLALRNVVDAADSLVKRYAALAEQGAMPIAEAQAQALASVAALVYSDGEYVWVNDLDLMMLAHPNPALRGQSVAALEDAAGKRFLRELVEEVERDGESEVDYLWRRTTKAAPALKISYGRRSAWDWVVATGLYADDVAATASARTWRLAFLALLIAMALTAVAWTIAVSITKPLKATVASLNELADGDGDLSRELPVDRHDELGELGRAFNLFVGKLRGLVAESRGVASRVSAAAAELSSAATQVAQASQVQASSLEETAASLEQITAAVKQNADSAREASRLATDSHQSAAKGGEVVAQAVTAVGQINASSRKIAAIISTIDEIAFQTNLLALNAAVEAARAGEQGRGFAVVASEVQSLARRSAGAAKEIKVLIEDSVAKVEAGSALVHRSGQTLEEIVASVKRVTDIIAEIAAASEEQSAGVDQVNQAVTQMDHGVQTTASQTEAVSSTSQTLTSEAMQLEALVGRFRLDAAEARSDVGGGLVGNLDFGKAMRAHAEWKLRLRAYVDHPNGSLKAAEVSRRDACALGKWLQTEAHQCEGCPEFAELVTEHARFHEEAGAIVRLAEERQRAEAIARLSAESVFCQISSKVVQLLGQLKAKISARHAAGRRIPQARRAA